jgi:hypothetical protein
MTSTRVTEQSCPAWVVRKFGDCDEYLNESKNKVCYGAVVVRSICWPGAFTIFNQGKSIHIYIGNGLKFDSTPYQYIYTPKFREDPKEYDSCPEPNPIKLPKPKEVV